MVMGPAPEKPPTFGTLGARRDTTTLVVCQIVPPLVAAVVENVTVTNTVRTPAPAACHSVDERLVPPTSARRPP